MSQFEENGKKMFSDQLKSVMKTWEKTNGKKLSHAKLANEIHVARETVSRWLRCESCPLDDENTLKSLCEFFKVPRAFFSKSNYDKGWTMVSEETHKELQADCAATAKKIGLSESFVRFVKETPSLSDSVISASWIDAGMQSLSPEVPETGNLFQFSSSSGVKIYPSDEALYMLRVVQRDLTEYASFLIQKWSKVIDDAHKKEMGKEWETGNYTVRAHSGEEYTSTCERFAFELRGRGSLTPGASLLVDMYNGMTGDEQEKLLRETHKAFRESRKKNPQAQKIRKAVREAMQTGDPVPPLSEILSAETDKP